LRDGKACDVEDVAWHESSISCHICHRYAPHDLLPTGGVQPMTRRELMQLAALAGTAALTASAADGQTKATGTRIQMLVYPGMTLQDLVGPLQVWAAWPGVQIQFAWKSAGPVTTDSGLAVVATTALQDAWTAPDILFTPGG